MRTLKAPVVLPAWVVVLTLLAILVISVAVVAREAVEPTCPTEDSCSIDYRDGRWVITETVP